MVGLGLVYIESMDAAIAIEHFAVSNRAGTLLGIYTVTRIGNSARALGRAYRQAAEQAAEAHGLTEAHELTVEFVEADTCAG